MTLLRAFRDDEHLPSYSLLVIRDAWTEESEDEEPDLPGLYEQEDSAVVGGFARAGAGWLFAHAEGDYSDVVLEFHDSVPADDGVDWDDVQETPYFSASGGVELDDLIANAAGSNLDLAGPGHYRVRVAKRRTEEGPVWCLRFWPEPVTAPQRLRRSQPALNTARSEWQQLIPFGLDDVLWCVAATVREGGEVTMERVDQWGRQHMRHEGWLDRPFWAGSPEPPPTGHPDMDAAHRARIADGAAGIAQKRALLAGWAASLGVPAPTSPRTMLEFYRAAGVIVGDLDGTSGCADPEPRARDVLRLTADQLAWLDKSENSTRLSDLAAELCSLALWSPGHSADPDHLAGPLLAWPQEIREALDYALAHEHLTVETGPDGNPVLVVPVDESDEEEFDMMASSGQYFPDEPAEDDLDTTAFSKQLDEPAEVGLGHGVFYGDDDDEFFWDEDGEPDIGVGIATGLPPAAGLVTEDGRVVVWREGAPVTLAKLERRPFTAVATPHGIVVDNDGATLVRPDGTLVELGKDLDIRSAGMLDGQRLVVFEQVFGRRPRSAIQLIDLVDGSREALPFREDDFHLALLGVHDGWIYFNGSSLPDPSRAATLRWRPGTVPSVLPDRLSAVDPYSGTGLAWEGTGVLVPLDGDRRPFSFDSSARLAPGGTTVYTTRHAPAAVTIFDPSAPESPRIHWLPGDPSFHGLIWESERTLLVPTRDGRTPGLRLNVQDGAVEQLPELLHGDNVIFVRTLCSSLPLILA